MKQYLNLFLVSLVTVLLLLVGNAYAGEKTYQGKCTRTAKSAARSSLCFLLPVICDVSRNILDKTSS